MVFLKRISTTIGVGLSKGLLYEIDSNVITTMAHRQFSKFIHRENLWLSSGGMHVFKMFCSDLSKLLYGGVKVGHELS